MKSTQDIPHCVMNEVRHEESNKELSEDRQ